MAKFKTLDDVDVKGKRVILRGDLNVPMKDGSVSDVTRIIRLFPTIKEISDNGGKVIIMSHFGRPKGEKVHSMSLKQLAKPLSEILNRRVDFINDCIGNEPEQAIKHMVNGDIILLENLRYYSQETENDDAFAEKLAALGDIYVNDAFATAHRAHASTHAIAYKLPAYAGRLMEAELSALNQALQNPERPVVGLVGGAKISTKLDVLKNLVQRLDTLILGGGMANTFLNAKGVQIGKSLCEHDMKDNALEIMNIASANNCKIILPNDAVIAAEMTTGAKHKTVSIEQIPEDEMILDIGTASVNSIKKELKIAKTVLWNGPMGAFETQPFDNGTNAAAKAIAHLTIEGKIISIVGGGDTVAALGNTHFTEQMTYVSTAGGAFLEWLEGKELPGVTALEENQGK